MEIEGFPLHADKLKEFGKVFEMKKEEAAKEVYALAGHEVNLNSPKQLADLLYNEMKLNGPKTNRPQSRRFPPSKTRTRSSKRS
jgi:DNA polymerase-1